MTDLKAMGRIAWRYQLDETGRVLARKFYRERRRKIDLGVYGVKPLFDRETARLQTGSYVCGVIDTLRAHRVTGEGMLG